MNSYGILLKEINGEYLLISKVEQHRKSLLSQLKNPLTLSFAIFCTDPLLLNYSDLSVNDTHQGFFLTNQDALQQTTLHKKACISEADTIILVTGYNTLNSYISDEEATITLTGADKTNVFFKGCFRNLKNTYSFTNLVQVGCFNIYIDSTPAKALKCYALESSTQKTIGILELSIDSNSYGEDAISYTATIDSRQVFWHYHVVNRESVIYKDFKIFSGKNTVPLQKETQITLGTGEKAHVLQTTNPISMSEHYDCFYELEFVREDLKTGQILSRKKVGLPVPEISKIKISRTESGFIAHSDMYIYL
jgi:hypothetical protein